MKFTQLITRSSLAAVALLNLSLATSAVAEPIIVNRGPNGAAHIVKSNHIPADAQVTPTSAGRPFPNLVQRGSHGALHIVESAEPMMKKGTQVSVPPLTQRGPHGAFVISNQS